MTEHDHLDLELQDLLDDRLSATERARVQTHVDACEQCRQDLEDLRRGRDFARRGLHETELPPDLLNEVVRQLGQATTGHGSAIGRRRVLLYGLGAVAAGLLATVYVRRRRDLPADVIDTFRAYTAGQRSLEVTTSDPATLEQFFVARLDFHTRVFDLGMMNYRLIGGRTDHVSDHRSAMYVYAGPNNRRLQCQMYRGALTELPQPSERRTNNDTPFLVYSRDGYTVVFWSEGDIVCVLVSDMPAEDTIALAFAKAMKV